MKPETNSESPSVSELFDASPIKEAGVQKTESTASPEKEAEKADDKKAVAGENSDNGKEKPEDKEVKSESGDKVKPESDEDKASPEAGGKPSADKEEQTVTQDRLKESQKWGNEANQRALKAEADLKQLKQDHGIEDTPVDDTEIAARLEERVKTSEAIERRIHGNEHIDKMIYAEDSVWQKIRHDPIIDMRVRNSDSPITEALLVVKETEFHDKYGDDPDTIVKGVKAELETELRKQIKKEYEDKLKQKTNLGSDLSNVKSDVATEADKKKVSTSTEDLFG